jgi:hypothetical protein
MAAGSAPRVQQTTPGTGPRRGRPASGRPSEPTGRRRTSGPTGIPLISWLAYGGFAARSVSERSLDGVRKHASNCVNPTAGVHPSRQSLRRNAPATSLTQSVRAKGWHPERIREDHWHSPCNLDSSVLTWDRNAYQRLGPQGHTATGRSFRTNHGVTKAG